MSAPRAACSLSSRRLSSARRRRAGLRPGVSASCPAAKASTPRRGKKTAPSTTCRLPPLPLTTEINFNLGGIAAGEPALRSATATSATCDPPAARGLIENPSAVPRCSPGPVPRRRAISPFEKAVRARAARDRPRSAPSPSAPPTAAAATRTFGVFNLEPPPGAPSELGFNALRRPDHLRPRDPRGRRRIRAQPRGAEHPPAAQLSGLDADDLGHSLGGRHNSQRGNCLNEAEPEPWLGRHCSVRLAPEDPAAGLPDAAHLLLPPLVFQPPRPPGSSRASLPGGSFPLRPRAPRASKGCDALAFRPDARAAPRQPPRLLAVGLRLQPRRRQRRPAAAAAG